MVRAVDHGVAVATTLVEDEPAGRWAQKVGAMIEAVALRAQLGPLDLQQELVGGAMRFMAVQAVFAHRRVFPQERAALLGMARVAVVVDRILLQQRVRGAAMRVVAIRAGQLAFAHRHM